MICSKIQEGKSNAFHIPCRIGTNSSLNVWYNETIWTWRLLFLHSFKFWTQIQGGLFSLSLSYWMSIGNLWIMRNWPIHLSCWIYMHRVFLIFPFFTLMRAICSYMPCFILDIHNLCLLSFFFVSFTRCLSNLLIFSEKHLFVSLIFSIIFPFLTELISYIFGG